MFESLFTKQGLSMERLTTLISVNEAGSIAAAAPRNVVRNSQNSRQLRELAEYFGCELTERRGKSVKVNEQGRHLAHVSREFFQALEDFRVVCAKRQVSYTIGAGDSLIQWLVIPRISSLVDSLPSVRINTESLRTNAVIERILDTRLDLGLVRKSALRTGIEAYPLGRVNYSLVIPHALLAGKSVPSAREIFRKYPIAIQASDGEFNTTLESIAKSLAPDFCPALACQSLPQVLAAVKSRRFAAVIPDIAIPDLPSNVAVPVKSEELKNLTREVYLIWNRRVESVRPMAAALVEACKWAFTIQT
jgi:DNA-binding transcriptional LysR family regulator